jgi:hypothetical protein
LPHLVCCRSDDGGRPSDPLGAETGLLEDWRMF